MTGYAIEKVVQGVIAAKAAHLSQDTGRDCSRD
jgi:hypothetical protein